MFWAFEMTSSDSEAEPEIAKTWSKLKTHSYFDGKCEKLKFLIIS
jgi:hypothetical protein